MRFSSHFPRRENELVVASGGLSAPHWQCSDDGLEKGPKIPRQCQAFRVDLKRWTQNFDQFLASSLHVSMS